MLAHCSADGAISLIGCVRCVCVRLLRADQITGYCVAIGHSGKLCGWRGGFKYSAYNMHILVFFLREIVSVCVFLCVCVM